MGGRPEGYRGPAWGSPAWKNSWRAVLLAAALLSSCFLLTQAQEIPVTMEPSQPLEGGDVTLTLGGNPNLLVCSWYRGGEAEPNRIFTFVPSLSEQQNGPMFTGRETGGPNCFLSISSLKLSDTGNYVVTKIASGGAERGLVHIEVLAAVLTSEFPLTQAQELPVMVEPLWRLKGEDVTLNLGGNANFLACFWYRGEEAEPNQILRYFPSSSQQQNGPKFTGRESAGPGCSLHIRSLVLNDTGHYVMTKIGTGGDEVGQVHIEVLEKLFPPVLWPDNFFVEEHANITLNCTTSESSSVTVSWLKDEKPVPAKAIFSDKNRTLTVPDISKDDEGTYTCEAGNPADSATSNPSKVAVDYSVPAPPASRSSLAAGVIAAIVLGSLAIAALAGTLLYCFFRSRNRKDKSSKQMNPTSPVYENTRPSVQVVPENSSVISNTYEELQYGNRAVYDQLRW